MSVRCKTCGQPLALSQLDGLCPACLIGQIGLQTDPESLAEIDETGATISAQQKAKPPGGIALDVAGFTILSELGRGGMGIVYRARQEFPAREVALKML